MLFLILKVYACPANGQRKKDCSQGHQIRDEEEMHIGWALRLGDDRLAAALQVCHLPIPDDHQRHAWIRCASICASRQQSTAEKLWVDCANGREKVIWKMVAIMTSESVMRKHRLREIDNRFDSNESWGKSQNTKGDDGV